MTVKQTSKMIVLTATVACAAGFASAQVVVGNGQTLTRADLLAGEFNSVPFTLGPDLVIDINDGGALDSLTYSGGYFDFMGTTINVNAGGLAFDPSESASTSFVMNLNMNVMPEALIGRMTARVLGGTNITMHGGDIRDHLFVHGGGWLGSGEFHMLGGSIGRGVNVSNGQRFTMAGGSIGDGLRVHNLASFNMSGGEIGDNFRISNQGFATISGGTVGDSLEIGAPGSMSGGSSFLTISGGSFGDAISVSGYMNDFGQVTPSYLSLHVTNLFLDGVRIELALNDPWLVTQRGGALLEATLADGSYFDLVLNDSIIDGQDYVSHYAVLRVTLVPAPGVAVLLGLSGMLAARRRARP